MDLRGIESSKLEWAGDCLTIGLFEDAVELTGDLVELDQKLSGTLQELITEVEFKGKAESSAVTRVGGNSPIRKIAIVGLGQAEALTLEILRRATAAAMRLAKREKCKTVGLSLPVWNQDAALTTQAIAEAIELTLHQDHRFKSENDDKGISLQQVDLLGLAGQDAAIQRARQVAVGVILARELVSAPANIVTPITMAETAEAIFRFLHNSPMSYSTEADDPKSS